MTIDVFKKKELIKKFMERWLHPGEALWAYQYQKEGATDVEYFYEKRPLAQTDFEMHFEQRPVNVRGRKKASLAVRGKFEGHRAKWFCIDADNDKAVDVLLNRLIPVFDAYNIEYVYEHSGKNDDRCHFWIMVDCAISSLKLFIEQVFREAGVDMRDRELQYELYPIIKENFVIRVPGGYHLKNKKVNPITYLGETRADAEFILETFTECKQYSEDEIRSMIKTPQKASENKRAYVSRNRSFFYSSRNLPLPVANLPTIIQKVAQNCQAVNQVLREAVDDELIERRGGMNHMAGLYLYNMAIFNDIRLSRSLRGDVDEGEKWAHEFFTTYRFRDYKSHNWNTDKRIVDNPDKLFPSCKTWDRDFGACDGCPFKDRPDFSNPKMFYYGKPIIKHLKREMRLVSPKAIRDSTFKTVKDRLIALVNSESRKKLLVASPQGSGKSYMIDDITAELARRGFNVLISVPTTDLAIEHKNRIEAAGQQAFAIMGHENMFKKMNPGFDCPFADEIKHFQDLGVGASSIKKRFCKNCTFAENCPYPEQYVKMHEPQYRAVIINHKHFSSPEAMHSILMKRFDVLFVDEAFVNDVLKVVKATPLEVEVLETFSTQFPWVPDMVRWLRDGGTPQGKAYVTPETLEILKSVFDDYCAPWNMPDFIRYYNLERTMDVNVGLHVFFPLPAERIPIIVMTDATPPLEMLKIVLNDDDIEVYGDDEVIDYRLMNPENKLIQVLDGSISKTALRGEALPDGGYAYFRLTELLEFIGDTAREKYPDKQILITTYKSYKAIAEEWFARNYPDVAERTLISHMAVGTNAFQDYEIQFLLAGVYLNGKDFHRDVFRLKTIKNYWNRITERPEIPNFYWYDLGPNASIERIPEKVRRINAVGNHAGEFEYPDFEFTVPLDHFYNLVEKFAIAKTQQAIRLRFNDDKLKVVYVFGKFFLPSFLVTDTVLEDDLLGYLRKAPE